MLFRQARYCAQSVEFMCMLMRHVGYQHRDIGGGKWPFDVISVIFPVEETKEEESPPLIARYPSREGSGLSGGGGSDDLSFQLRRAASACIVALMDFATVRRFFRATRDGM
jgi:hypothetical protein